MAKNINLGFLGSIALVVVFGAGAITYFLNRETELDKLFDKYFEVYRGIPDLGESQTSNITFAEAMQSYQSGDYKASIKTLKAITKSDTAKAEHFFFLGNSLLAINKPSSKLAKAAFREVFSLKSGYIPESQWYFALACLKSHDEEGARNMLWEIARKGTGFKQAEARKIVDKLMVER